MISRNCPDTTCSSNRNVNTPTSAPKIEPRPPITAVENTSRLMFGWNVPAPRAAQDQDEETAGDAGDDTGQHEP